MQRFTDLEVHEKIEKALGRVISTDTSPRILTLLRRLYTQELTAQPLVHSLFCYPQWNDKDLEEQYLSICQLWL